MQYAQQAIPNTNTNTNTNMHTGCTIATNDTCGFANASKLARKAEVVVAVMGISQVPPHIACVD